MIIAIALAGCYFLGSIPFGLIIGKLVKGIDIRDYGSGNIGTTNAQRILGTGPAIFVMVLDTAKGLLAVLVCYQVSHDYVSLSEFQASLIVVAGAMLSILGHTFSLFLNFKGGKGVATSLGVIIGLNWQIALIAFVGWVLIVAVTRYVSIASIVASSSVPLQMVFWKSLHVPAAYQVLAGVAALAIVLKHTSNIKRLVNGTEARFGQRVDVPEETSGEPMIPTEE